MNTNILFPAKARLLSYGIIALLIVLGIVGNQLGLRDLNEELKSLFFQITTGLLCLSLFLIQFSKYPEEDEMLLEIRLKLILHTMFIGTLYLIISPIVQYFIFQDKLEEIPASQIILFMLLYQILIFQMKRYSLKKELAKE
jgi:hypothetical protein